jgi:hypothetical protein
MSADPLVLALMTGAFTGMLEERDFAKNARAGRAVDANGNLRSEA